MARFNSKEEYEQWRAAQRGGGAGPVPGPSEGANAVPAEQVYDGPPPGSAEFHDAQVHHAGLATDRDRTMAMLCHVTSLLGFVIPLGNVLGPLVVWMMGKKDSDFVDEHGKASLNFQISLVVALVLFVVLGFFMPILVFLVPIVGLIALYAIVMAIVNGVRANRGEDVEYALSTRFIR